MRRRILTAVLMTTLCLLCACAGGGNEPLQTPLDFRAEFLSHGGCAFELEAVAETGELCWSLTLACALDEAGSGSVTVLAPESIAGIRAVTDGETGSLTYDGLALGLGTLPDTELAPAAAPGVLARAWAQTWIASAGLEGEETRAVYEDGGLRVDTWFDVGGVPVRVALALDGQTRFTAEIRNFTWKDGTEHETTQENLG